MKNFSKHKQLLHKGKWANADIYRVNRSGKTMIYKGFDNRSFLVRWTIGTLLTQHEVRNLQRLSELDGVPGDVQSCGPPYALCSQYVQGITLGDRHIKEKRLPLSYFLEAERLLAEIHERGVVHLDLRKANNWMINQAGKPVIIDFQSAVDISHMPALLRKKLCEIDYSGLYKLWEKVCNEPLDPERRKLLERVNRMRRFWVFRGYAFKRKTVRKRSAKLSN
jgi:tRNA A-37 threonylcarbamoyl transferase component Bud32